VVFGKESVVSEDFRGEMSEECFASRRIILLFGKSKRKNLLPRAGKRSKTIKIPQKNQKNPKKASKQEQFQKITKNKNF
jgi:hypothetical protein